MQDLAITFRLAPGDTIVLTGLLRDLQLAHPGRFRVLADVAHAELLRFSPHVAWAGRHPGEWPATVRRVRAEYGAGIRRSAEEPVHFLAWMHRDFERQTGVAVPVALPHPDLHLGPAERTPPVPGRYWVFVAGGKDDATTKVWSPRAWQDAADLVRALGVAVVQAGARLPGHRHFPLAGVVDLVGRTTLREFVRLIAHADGVVCGITAAMHAAAALGRPCVVLGGGREARHWAAYERTNVGLGPRASLLPVAHRFLVPADPPPCGKPGGCWRNQVVPVPGRRGPCFWPAVVDGEPVAECMRRIAAADVAAAVAGYYRDGTLPPP